VVQSFCTVGLTCSNGEVPSATPVLDSGTLYGVTEGGGDATNQAGILWSIP